MLLSSPSRSRLSLVPLLALVVCACSSGPTSPGPTIQSVTVKLDSTGTSTGTTTPGRTELLKAVVQGTGAFDSSVQWEVSPGGTLMSNGLQASFSSTTLGTFTITARSRANTSVVGTATVLVQADTNISAITLVTSPNPPTVDVGVSVLLTALPQLSSAISFVTWSSPAGGMLNAGSVSANFSATEPGDYPVRATSVGNPAVSATTTIHVELPGTSTHRFGTRLLGNDESAAGVAMDPAGNLYVLGGVACETSCDSYVQELDPTGRPGWRSTLDSGDSDEPTAIAFDPSSAAIIVVGQTQGTLPGATPSNAGGYDAFVAKLDAADGHPLWTRLIGTATDDGADGVAVDSQGEIYVVGHTSGTIGTDAKPGLVDVFLAHLDAAGTVQKVRLYGSTADDNPRSIALAPPDGLFVVGSTLGSLDGVAPGGTDAFLARFDRSTGAFSWVAQYRSAGAENQQAFAVTADSGGNALITGFSLPATFEGQTVSAASDAFVSKVSPEGNKIWTRLVLADAGTSTDHLKGFGIAALSEDSVVIAGTDTAYSSTGGTNKGFIARFGPSGDRATWAPLRITSTFNAGLDGLAVDPAGNIVAVGSTDSTIDGVDFAGPAATLITTFGPSGEHP